MPDFWQFPTGSMGLGPISSIYHARFMRYLQHRGCSTRARAPAASAARRSTRAMNAASGACSATARWTSPRA